MTTVKKVIKSVRRVLSGKKEVKRISDLCIKGNGWRIVNGEYFEG